MELVFIQDLVKSKIEQGSKGFEIAKDLNISVPMVSSYKNYSYKPSLNVAKFVYANEGIVLHPFSEESLKYEIRIQDAE